MSDYGRLSISDKLAAIFLPASISLRSLAQAYTADAAVREKLAIGLVNSLNDAEAEGRSGTARRAARRAVIAES